MRFHAGFRYYGWVVGVPLNNPGDVMAWATTARGGGAWSVGGVASDGTDPFVATGNTFGASSWGGGEAIIHLQPNLVLTNGTTNFWAPTNWPTLDGEDLDIGGSGPLLVDVPGATPSNLVVALGKDQNVYLLNRTNLGGITRPLAQSHVATTSIIQAAATYRTAKGTYVVFANNNNLYSLRIGATSPPTIATAWTVSENGRGSPFVTSTDGTNDVVVWGIGSEDDGRLHGFDGDTGTNVFTGGGTNELMAGTRRFNTGIVARGHIYVANDNRVYSFSVPSQASVSPVIQSATQTGNSFTFSWSAAAAQTYQIQYTTDLTQNVWSNFGGPITATNSTAAASLSISNSQAFYRVVLLP